MSANNDKVSIIVPVYNVEPYIKQCVESCLQQDYENIEILLVDDGSTDNSGIICDELKKMSAKIRVFHKENSGPSDSRNYGIEHSKGEFVIFVDSDDIVERELVSTLFKGIEDYKCDIAICGFTHFNDGEVPRFAHDTKYHFLNKEDAIIEFLYQRNIYPSSCAKIYRKGLLKNNKFVKGQQCEDNDFLFRVFLSCKKVGLNKSLLYAYRHRIGSRTTSDFLEMDFDIIEIGKHILKDSKEMGADVYRAAVTYQITNCLRIFMTTSNKYYADERFQYCIDFIRDHFKETLKDNNVRLKVKVALIMNRIGIPASVMKLIRNSGNRWD